MTAAAPQTVSEIKPLKKKKNESSFLIDPDKLYVFELSHSFDMGRPTEKGTGAKVGTPYPAAVDIPNEGIAFHPKTGKASEWRYIEGQPSIWKEDQTTFDNFEPRDMQAIMGRPENKLSFYDGKIEVPGIHETKIEALMVSDYFEGNPKPYRGPSNPVDPMYKYRLLNPDAEIEKSLSVTEFRYQAINAAMNASLQEMFAVCGIYGIDTDDRSPVGLNRIKQAFLQKAEFDPKNPEGVKFFIDTLSNPATKVRFIFSEGLKKGIISTIQQPGKLTWAKPNTAITDLDSKQVPVEELTNRALIQNEQAIVEVMTRINDELNK